MDRGVWPTGTARPRPPHPWAHHGPPSTGHVPSAADARWGRGTIVGMAALTDLHRVLGLAARQHGVIARWQALEFGMHPSAIVRRCRTDQWRILHTGVYLALADAASSHTDLAAATLAIRGGLACGSSAAWLHGFRGFARPARPEVLTRRRRPQRLDDVLVRTSCHPDRRASRVAGISTTSVARTAVDISSRMSAADYTDVVADLVRRRATSLAQLTSVVDSLGRPHGAVQVRDTVALLGGRPGTDSALEDDLLRLLLDVGLPPPDIGHDVRDGRGAVIARLDFAYPELGIALEVDGLRFHATPREKARDDRRQNALVVAGWVVLRFSALDIRRYPRRVVASVRAAIDAQGGPAGLASD